MNFPKSTALYLLGVANVILLTKFAFVAHGWWATVYSLVAILVMWGALMIDHKGKPAWMPKLIMCVPILASVMVMHVARH